jgi:hypothetical protein
MRVVRKLLAVVIFVLGCNACFHPPDFSIIPAISTPLVLKFYQFAETDSDYVAVTFNFTDGDGDLGFDSSNPSDLEGIYANKYFFNLQGTLIDFGSQTVTSRYFYNPDKDKNPNNNPNPVPNDTLVSYDLKRRKPTPFDSLPDFVSPYECTRWYVSSTTVDSVTFIDTLYVQLNKNYYNIFVDIYIYDGTNYNLFDFTREFTYPLCNVRGFNGRFPILTSDPSKPGPQEGKIEYDIQSVGWITFFGPPKLLKIGLRIEDRATHQSNYLLSNAFRLSDI